MNNSTTKTSAIVAILMAATLAIGTFATVAATQTAFAYQKKRGGSQENGKNGNTVTIQKCKQDGTVSGFDNTEEQECQNVICTHPGENATCSQEGVRSTPTSTPEPTTTTLRVIKSYVCLPIDPNCALVVNGCRISLLVRSQDPQTFTCQSAVGNGVLFTLQTGDDFSFEERFLEPPFFDVSFSSDCESTITAGQHLTCTITNIER
jgi:hypothetical protein